MYYSRFCLPLLHVAGISAIQKTFTLCYNSFLLTQKAITLWVMKELGSLSKYQAQDMLACKIWEGRNNNQLLQRRGRLHKYFRKAWRCYAHGTSIRIYSQTSNISLAGRLRKLRERMASAGPFGIWDLEKNLASVPMKVHRCLDAWSRTFGTQQHIAGWAW